MPYWSRMIVTRLACFFHEEGCAGTVIGASSRVAAMTERNMLRMGKPTEVYR